MALCMVSCGKPKGFVDLGLPSGLLWAECNLGAVSPDDFGNYYAWGETAVKDSYDQDNYRHALNGYELAKYCNDEDYGRVDNLTRLEADDDAATANSGKGVRLPTAGDWKELLDNCKVEWTTHKGTAGVLLTGPDGNSLFLPAAGYRDGSELVDALSGGYYWSASLYEDIPDDAWHMYFHSEGQSLNNDGRSLGLPIRAVCR